MGNETRGAQGRAEGEGMSDIVTVTNADFNGSSWDGCPFSEIPGWLKDAIAHDLISVHPDDLDYAVWDVQTKSGNVRALPGDQIKFVGEDGPFEVIEVAEKHRHPSRLPKAPV